MKSANKKNNYSEHICSDLDFLFIFVIFYIFKCKLKFYLMKKKITITILFVLLGLNITLQAQTILTYSGDYPLSYPFVGQNGKATYKYYDDPITYNRIKEGLFIFKFKGVQDYAPYEITITGNYKHNLKDGAWTYTTITKDAHDEGSKYYISGTSILKANYKNGKLNGVLQSNISGTSREKKFNHNTNQWEFTQPTLPETEKMNTNFKNGKVTGNFTYSKSNPVSKTNQNITATLDTAGYVIGKYVEKNETSESIFEFNNDGVGIKSVVRDLKTGEAKVKQLTEATDLEHWKKYQYYKKNFPDSLQYVPFKFQFMLWEGCGAYKKLKELFFQDFLLLRDIKGDVDHTSEGYNINGFYYVEIVE